MIRICASTAVAITVALGAGAVTYAQSTGAARHVRSVPIRVGRLIGAPIVDEVGSFAALRSNTRYAEVIGIVQHQSGTLVPNAGVVRVRNLHTGILAATTQVNALAQFSVRSLPPGLYVAELIGSAGTVIASTPAFSAGAGEVVQIAQTVPTAPIQGWTGTLRSATSAALSSAAGAGILAVAPGVSVTPGS